MYRPSKNQKNFECLLRMHKIEKCAKDGLSEKDFATSALNFRDKTILEKESSMAGSLLK